MAKCQHEEEEIKTITNQVKNGRIERVDEHKMLGTWLDTTGGYEINIRKRKEKLSFMLSTVKNQARQKTVGIMAVEARLKLAEIVIVLSCIHNVEGFPSHTENELKQMESMQLTILTGILELPASTPYCALLMETGWWTMRARVAYRKLMLYHNIIKSDEQRVIKELVRIQQKAVRDSTWYASVRKAIEYYGITIDAEKVLKSTWKKHVKTKINTKLAEEITQECSSKTKSRTVMKNEYKRKEYIGKLSITETKKIMKARLHMTKIPGNFKQLGILKCPLCNDDEIRTEHYFECGSCRHLADAWGVTKNDLRTQNMEKMKDVGNFLEKVELLLEPVMETKMERGNQSTKTYRTKRKIPSMQSNIAVKRTKR